MPHAASAKSSHSQPIVNRYPVVRDAPKAGSPCRYAPQAASPPSARKNSAVCQMGATALGMAGVGCATAGAFMVVIIGRQSLHSRSKTAARRQPFVLLTQNFY